MKVGCLMTMSPLQGLLEHEAIARDQDRVRWELEKTRGYVAGIWNQRQGSSSTRQMHETPQSQDASAAGWSQQAPEGRFAKD